MERETYTIVWKTTEERPEDGSYVLVRCVNESGEVVCEFCAYEGGKFLYIYDRDTWGEVNEELIFGWSYLPYDEH